MKRKILSILLALCLLVNLVPYVTPTASAATYSGTCGDNLTWTLDTETGLLRISGTGQMTNWIGSGAPWRNYSKIRSVEIDAGVTSIGDFAFYSREELTSVIIPDSLTSIGDSAFCDCDGLTGVTIPDSVTSIGDSAFYACDGLTSVTISDGVISIGHSAFAFCDGLTSVTVSDSVTSIDCNAFGGCIALQTIEVDEANQYYANDVYGVLYNKDTTTLIACPGAYSGSYSIPDSVTSVGDYAFIGCDGLTGVTIPDSVTSIGDSAFCSCDGLTGVTIPDSVTSIGDAAFDNCSGLTSVTIPDSVTSIGDYAFYGCDGLTGVTIPDSVTSIGREAFGMCVNLTSVTIPNSVSHIAYGAFSYCSGLTSVTIGNSVTSIGGWAFLDCNRLTSVTIGNSVTSIGEGAFSDCTELTDVYYTGTEEMWNEISIGGNNDPLLNATIHFEYVFGAPIPDYSGTCGDNLTWGFYTDTGLLRISGTGPMTSWSNGATPWYDLCSEIQTVEIDSGVTSIGDYAFEYCSSLTSVIIPNSVTSIGKYTFRKCSGLISVTIPSSVTSIGQGAFFYCSGLTNVTIPNSVTSIGDYAFAYCSGLTNVTIPNSVTSIGDYAFAYCSGLTNVTIPDSVASIGSHAFYDCTGLTSVTIPSSVTSIGNYAFYRCSGLTSVTIPDSVISIGEYAFAGCTKLERITVDEANQYYTNDVHGVLYSKDGATLVACPGAYSGSYSIPDSVISIGDGAFESCYALVSVTFGNSVTSIGNYAFCRCSGLTSVTFGNSVTSIDCGAFQYCGGLTSVTIPDSVTFVADEAFADCSELTDVYYAGTEEEWNKIRIYPGNDDLEEANIHFQCCPHGATEFQEGVDASCTESGRIPCYFCEECERYYEDQAGTKVIIDWPAIEPLGHSYNLIESIPANCNWTGANIYVCVVCGDSKTEIIPVTGHVYDQGTVTQAATCTETGILTYTCVGCGETKTEVAPAKGHHFVYRETIEATCTEAGAKIYCCEGCGATESEEIPAKGHKYIRYSNNGAEHIVGCAYCMSRYSEAHYFVSGDCICGAKESDMPKADESIQIRHTLDLASDIAITFAVAKADLAEYDSYYLEVVLPEYKGNELIGTSTVQIQPVESGNYYYFTLTGITAVRMGDMVEAVLHMTKDGTEYISNTDRYSVATYAYAMMKSTTDAKMLTLCADLLRYGAEAQSFKKYRTDALVDAAMTDAQRAYLSNTDTLTFTATDSYLGDLANPAITWVGKTLDLGSKVGMKFVFNAKNYSGDIANLSMKVSYQGTNGETKSVTLTGAEVYSAANSYYSFTFYGLLASELRTIVDVAIYEGETQLSETLRYSAESYASKTGDTELDALSKAIFAYSDSAKTFFAK